jgi:hypothetical protein
MVVALSFVHLMAVEKIFFKRKKKKRKHLRRRPLGSQKETE